MKRGSQWEPLLFARQILYWLINRWSIDSQRTKLLFIVCLLITRSHIVLIFYCLCLLCSKRSREYIILLTILFLTGSLEFCGETGVFPRANYPIVRSHMTLLELSHSLAKLPDYADISELFVLFLTISLRN